MILVGDSGGMCLLGKKSTMEVTMDEMLCELETDKVTVEVPATVEGTLSEIIAKEGDTVGVDAILAIISASEKQTPKEIAAAISKIFGFDYTIVDRTIMFEGSCL